MNEDNTMEEGLTLAVGVCKKFNNYNLIRNGNLDDCRNYLLSIRGLGLKSVECVRLLTLHHLAFPVSILAAFL